MEGKGGRNRDIVREGKVRRKEGIDIFGRVGREGRKDTGKGKVGKNEY